MSRSSAVAQLAFDEKLVTDPTLESALEHRLARKVVLDKVRKQYDEAKAVATDPPVDEVPGAAAGMRSRLLGHAAVAGLLLASCATPAIAGDGRTEGVASWYGPGDGVATKWCTWTLRHSAGCGLLAIQSLDTGVVVIAPVIDWCQCYRGTAQERIVDLQWDVVAALGLDRPAGLYPVATWRVDEHGAPIDPAQAGGGQGPEPVAASAVIPPAPQLPDTAVWP